jgi:hypothetical protein
MDDAAATPYLLIGTVDEIVAHMVTCNERWGINYFAVRELDEFEPVLTRVALTRCHTDRRRAPDQSISVRRRRTRCPRDRRASSR